MKQLSLLSVPGSSTLRLLAGLSCLFCATTLPAQWLTQSFDLLPGWNAIYSHVDATHEELDDLLSETNVTQVWMWTPALSSLQFVDSPANPTDSDTRWLSWKAEIGVGNTLTTFYGNAAYLVYLSGEVAESITVKGKPVSINYQWSSDGLNFIGFPSVGTVSFEDYFTHAPSLLANGDFLKYTGGELSSSNPAQIFATRTEQVERGRAYWVRDETEYNRYFAPFSIKLSNLTGIEFGSGASTATIKLTNHTSEILTVTLTSKASEIAPVDQTTITGTPQILVQGELDLETLTTPFEAVAENGTYQWVLNPADEEGSSVRVILGLDRSVLSGSAGDLFAGILEFSDSLGHSRIDVPVSAEKASNTGLWVGIATISEVKQDLAEATDFTGVPREFGLRLIVHVPASGDPTLLQRVYYGIVETTDESYVESLATSESYLDQDTLAQAGRISAPHLPWTESNTPWGFSGGSFDLGEVLTTTVSVGHDDHRSNPFLHTYHPDHDNLNATFDASLDAGEESYRIDRDLTLSLLAPDESFTALTSSGTVMVGSYAETITLSGSGDNTKTYEVQGDFTLTKISDVDTLTTAND